MAKAANGRQSACNKRHRSNWSRAIDQSHGGIGATTEGSQVEHATAEVEKRCDSAEGRNRAGGKGCQESSQMLAPFTQLQMASNEQAVALCGAGLSDCKLNSSSTHTQSTINQAAAK